MPSSTSRCTSAAASPMAITRSRPCSRFCADGDVLTLIAGGGLQVTGPFTDALGGGDNLVLRAAKGFTERCGGAPAGFLLDKRLPVAAGIGGGSADAAAAPPPAVRALWRGAHRSARDRTGGRARRRRARLPWVARGARRGAGRVPDPACGHGGRHAGVAGQSPRRAADRPSIRGLGRHRSRCAWRGRGDDGRRIGAERS